MTNAATMFPSTMCATLRCIDWADVWKLLEFFFAFVFFFSFFCFTFSTSLSLARSTLVFFFLFFWSVWREYWMPPDCSKSSAAYTKLSTSIRRQRYHTRDNNRKIYENTIQAMPQNFRYSSRCFSFLVFVGVRRSAFCLRAGTLSMRNLWMGPLRLATTFVLVYNRTRRRRI